jgi:hypothetical protein
LIAPIASRLRVWHVLALGFAARVAVGLSTDSVLQPDEVMQYLEQAHRLVFGAGMIPWEYDYGVRSWTPALLIAGVLETVRLAGFDSPQVYQPAVKAALSAVSLVVPYSAYRIGRALFSEQAGWLALLFTTFWYELVTYGHRATIDALGTYAAMGALALVCAAPGRRVIVACGAVLGLTCVLRYQLAPAVAAIGIVAIWRWRGRAWPAMVAGALVVAAGGALDAYTWGYWFASIIESFDFNVTQHQAVRFGTQPFYWYAIVVVVLSGGLCLAGGLGLLLSWRRSWPLIGLGLVTAVAFSVVEHKEPRFVFLLTPLWLIGLAALAAPRGRVVGALLIAAFAAVSALGLDQRLPYERRFIRRQIARVPTREAYRVLAAHRDVVAVLDASATDRDSPWYLTPYYDLHHDVPLYWPLSHGFEPVQADPRRYVSHVITPADAPAPAGFRALTRVSNLMIWRRDVDPPETHVFFGYDRRIAALQPIRFAPRVLPRW